jgi:hypothetical protein
MTYEKQCIMQLENMSDVLSGTYLSSFVSFHVFASEFDLNTG